MEYTEDFLKKIIYMGALGYPASKIINIMDMEGDDAVQFLKDFEDTASDVYKSYHRGRDKADYKIDSKLYQEAEKGDPDALKTFNERKEINEDKAAEEKELRDIIAEKDKM